MESIWSAFTVNSVAEDMKGIDCLTESQRGPQIRNVRFPGTEKKTVDMLIGVNYPELHLSLKHIESSR